MRDVSADMEENKHHSAGLPDRIYTLLCSLGEDTCSETVWTLRHTKFKFYLDIQWPRKNQSLKIPAKKPHDQSHLENIAKDGPTPPGNPSGSASLKDSAEVIAGVEKLAENRSSVQPKSGKPVVTSTGKKRKSPSTRKRNRLRWERWQAKRRAKRANPKSSCQPVPNNCPQDYSNPNPADVETCQQGSERNIPCTSQNDLDTSPKTIQVFRMPVQLLSHWRGRNQAVYTVRNRNPSSLSA